MNHMIDGYDYAPGEYADDYDADDAFDALCSYADDRYDDRCLDD